MANEGWNLTDETLPRICGGLAGLRALDISFARCQGAITGTGERCVTALCDR